MSEQTIVTIEKAEEASALKAALALRLEAEIQALNARMVSIYRQQTLDNAPLILYGLTGELNALLRLRENLDREHRRGAEALAKEHQDAIAKTAIIQSFL